MKLRTLLLLVFFPAMAFATTDAERELQRMVQERNTAIASAIDPINHRYKLGLEQLLRQATLSGDLDSALQIRAALQALEAAPSANATVITALMSHIINTTWTFWGSETITFMNGGKLRHSSQGVWDWKLDPNDPMTVNFENQSHNPFSITFESDFKTGAMHGSLNQATHRVK